MNTLRKPNSILLTRLWIISKCQTVTVSAQDNHRTISTTTCHNFTLSNMSDWLSIKKGESDNKTYEVVTRASSPMVQILAHKRAFLQGPIVVFTGIWDRWGVNIERTSKFDMQSATGNLIVLQKTPCLHKIFTNTVQVENGDS